MRAQLLTVGFMGALALGARAQETGDAAAPPPPEPAWVFDLSLYQYFVPGDDNYLQPTLTADRGGLHLEARYNYEDLDTASIWAGWNLGWGDEVTLELTPMLGAAFGSTDGAALGYHCALDWRSLELYGEGEYLFDFSDSDDSYIYSWTELTVMPTDWLRAGLVAQRTRAYESDLDVQRGFLAGLELDRASLTIHCFNPDQGDPIWMLAFATGF